MSEWISVKDRLPMEPDKTVGFETMAVIVTDGTHVCEREFQRGGGVSKPWAAWNHYGVIAEDLITHWMPMPTPPVTEEPSRVEWEE